MQALDELYNSLIKDITKEVEKQVMAKINVQPVLDEPLTPDEVAKFLKVDKTTIYKLCKEGQIKSVKLGSIHSKKPHLRIFKKDLMEWAEKSRELPT
nr:MAG TPA: helix-turn-helix domain protein [Caudoviricetes sp.]